MNNANWILNSPAGKQEFDTFPLAFRRAHEQVRAASSTGDMLKKITIAGPPNARNERATYSYPVACQMARDAGWLSMDGHINAKEFKKR